MTHFCQMLIDFNREVVEPVIMEVLQGYSCTIFAYGQTGTGKTYTMEGEKSEGSNFSWENDPKSGIIPRTMNHLFDELNSSGNEFSGIGTFLVPQITWCNFNVAQFEFSESIAWPKHVYSIEGRNFPKTDPNCPIFNCVTLRWVL